MEARRLALVLMFLFLLALPPVQRVAPLETTKPRYVYYFPISGLPSNAPAPVRPANKRGVGLTHSLCADEFGTWGYDWSGRPPSCAVETVPMAWGGLPGVLGGNSDWLMGFNEPDLPDQSNLTPERAAELWVQIETLYPDRKLVSPAPSHLHPEWLPAFRQSYINLTGQTPRLDALALHCYLPTANQCMQLVQQFEAWAHTWGIGEIWITEFSFSTLGNARTQDAAWQEDAVFIAWMDAEPMVGRYAYFAARIYGDEWWAFPSGWNASLLDRDGKDTFWGLHYKE